MANQKSNKNGRHSGSVSRSIFGLALVALFGLSTQRLQLLSPMSLQGKFISNQTF